jgi:hypothetical protein
MTMKIVLGRKASVRVALVEGKVAFTERRVPEHAVVLWAAERHRAGLPAGTAALCDAASGGPLAGMSPVVGRRLARVCEDLGLLHVTRDEIIALTPEGDRVAASEEPRIFVPQTGAWLLSWSEDPLLPHPLLRIAPGKEPSARDERQARQAREQRPRRRFVELPQALGSLCDARSERPPIAPPVGSPVRLLELGSKVELQADESVISVELSFPPQAAASLRLRGALAGEKINQSLPTPHSHDHAGVWLALLRTKSAERDWNPTTGKLRASFSDDLSADARRSFRRQMTFAAPTFDGLGCFDDTTVEGIPLEPATASDAQQWFEWSLVDRTDRPQWPDVFAANVAATRALFPGFPVRAPSQRAVAAALRGIDRPRSAYWHLQSTLDLPGGGA